MIYLFYLLTLFNVDYKTLAAYALIKIETQNAKSKKEKKSFSTQ